MHKRFMKNVCTLKGKHSIELLSYMYLFWVKGEVARVRSCEGESEKLKERKCDDAKRRIVNTRMAKVRSHEGEGTILLSFFRLCNFAHRNTIGIQRPIKGVVTTQYI